MDIRKISFNAISESDKEDVRKAYREKRITAQDIRLLSLVEVAMVYNNIKDFLYGTYLEGKDTIVHREHIDNHLENEKNYNRNVYKCFQILKSIGYISMCGRGYVFDNPKIRLTEEEVSRLDELIFEIL